MAGQVPQQPGGVLRRYRTDAGIGQGELAKRAGISVRALRDIERSRVARPHPGSVWRLAVALDLPEHDRAALLRAFAGDSGGAAGDQPGARVEALGSLRVWHRGRVVDVEQAMLRTLLGLLALHAGRPVAVAVAVGVLWDDDPPKSCHNLIQVYVARLRRMLADRASGDVEPIRLTAAGYVLVPSVVGIDVCDFDADCDQAERAFSAGDLDLAAARYVDALRRWRGPVLGDADERLRHHPAAVGAARRRVEAAMAYADLALERAPAEVVGCLSVLADSEPLHEGLHARLIRALLATGEQADAVRVFIGLRDRLLDQLGVSPGPQVTAAYDELLHPPATAREVSRVPAQLPRDSPAFTGRRKQLRQLEQRADASVVVITGPGGVGKTSLAVHWAHRAAADFPDGQVYLDLRGYHPDGIIEPAAAIRDLLDALGVEPVRVPASPAAQEALLRSLTAGRRLLVVLDNVRDADHVRPLLPAGPATCTVITSRDRLTDIVARVDALPIAIDVPDHAEAAELFLRRAGMPQPPEAVAAILTACGRLPLALALVAARARQTSFPLTAVAADLLRPGHALNGVRSVFSWSIDALSAADARLFRLMGLTADGDIGTAAAAALADVSQPAVRRSLRALVEASLVTEPLPGRYQLHDLLRVYAAELARGTDSEVDRREALTRLLDFYTHAAYQADLILNPSRAPIPARLGASGPPPPFDTRTVLAWLAAERAALVSALRQAADEGLDQHAWQLGWALDTFLTDQRRWHDEGAAWAVALRAATALANQPAAAHAHGFLAVVAGRLDRFDEAHKHIREALDMCRAHGDLPGEAEILFMLSYVCWLQSDADGALEHVEQSLELWLRLDNDGWAGKASNAVGLYHSALGAHQHALACYERALALHQRAGDHAGEVVARDNLGQANDELGHHAAAADHYRQGLLVARATADPVMEGRLSLRLGDACQAVGDESGARNWWRQAHEILADLGHPQAAEVSRRLADT
jgi:DNA-binding SARP family transcriptional activator/tetratricopeptide (TPR) repeat protein/DNA-binding XRE family transcriptional regulator